MHDFSFFSETMSFQYDSLVDIYDDMFLKDIYDDMSLTDIYDDMSLKDIYDKHIHVDKKIQEEYNTKMVR